MEQFPGEQKEEAPVRNLKTNPADTIRAMAEVEGPTWFKLQVAAQENRINASDRAVSVQQALENLEKRKRTVVYGADGKNRWFVEPDGAVSFSEQYAHSLDHLHKARELGFQTVP